MIFSRIISECAACNGLVMSLPPKPGPSQKYCCVDCKRIGQGVKRKPLHGSCEVCGNAFVGNANRRRCTNCQSRSRRRYESCGYCRKPFVGSSSGQTYCSLNCAKAARILLPPEEKKARLQQQWRRSNHVRRARIRNSKVELFKSEDIFERDGYQCQMCGKKTNPKLRDHNHDLYPTIDHIIPLSKGGEHSRLNTQCLCRKCNMAKRDVSAGQQLRLIA